MGKGFVEAKHEPGFFGNSAASSSSHGQALDEFELDETCVCKRDLANETADWNECVGMKQRGGPESLYLQQRDAKKEQAKQKVEWRRVATAVHEKGVAPNCKEESQTLSELFNAAMVPKRISKTWTESSATMSVTASQEIGLNL